MNKNTNWFQLLAIYGGMMMLDKVDENKEELEALRNQISDLQSDDSEDDLDYPDDL